MLIQTMVSHLPVNKDSLYKYSLAQQANPICSQIQIYCKSGWPSKHRIRTDLIQYWLVKGELTIANNLLYRDCIVIPKDLQMETLHKIHQGHQGIIKCHL